MKKIGLIALITLATFLVAYLFIQPYYIYSAGMQPEVNNGEIVLLKKRPKNYKLDDIVVYENGVELVGRIVATPDDVVEVEDNKLYVNSEYVANYDAPDTVYVLDNQYLVINNENFGYIIDAKQIIGEIR